MCPATYHIDCLFFDYTRHITARIAGDYGPSTHDIEMRGLFKWTRRSRAKIASLNTKEQPDGNWSSFQLAKSTPPQSVIDYAIAPSARIDRTVARCEYLTLYIWCLCDNIGDISQTVFSGVRFDASRITCPQTASSVNTRNVLETAGEIARYPEFHRLRIRQAKRRQRHRMFCV